MLAVSEGSARRQKRELTKKVVFTLTTLLTLLSGLTLFIIGCSDRLCSPFLEGDFKEEEGRSWSCSLTTFDNCDCSLWENDSLIETTSIASSVNSDSSWIVSGAILCLAGCVGIVLTLGQYCKGQKGDRGGLADGTPLPLRLIH